MTEANRSLPDEVFIEVFDLLRLPELRREHILVTVSDTATTECVETPLIQLAILSYSGCVVLVHINIDEFD